MTTKELDDLELSLKDDEAAMERVILCYIQDLLRERKEAITLLRELVDIQNGPPLAATDKEWEDDIIKRVYVFLHLHEEEQP